MELPRDFRRVAIPWTADPLMAGQPAICPNCKGPLPDLWGELTDDPKGVANGTKAIDCYYCEAALRYNPHPQTKALGGSVELAQGEALEKRCEAKMLMKVVTAKDWADEVQAYGQAKGLEMKNPLGVRAFEGYRWKEGSIYQYP